MSNSNAIKYVGTADQQHMLFLFLPIKKELFKQALEAVHLLHQAVKTAANDPDPDMRAQTGVHFFMFYAVPAGSKSKLPVTTFQPMPGKDLLVVQAIYDAEFTDYIGAFVQQEAIANGLNSIVSMMDESDIPGIDADGPNSANYIKGNGWVQSNPDAFNCLLMNYNFADPTAAGKAHVTLAELTNPLFGATFPGLSVSNILTNYSVNGVTGVELWPFPPATDVEFAQSSKPDCS
jgi:hypothetical protein